jgi:membrane protein implicated in regulation of membrane protease activity
MTPVYWLVLGVGLLVLEVMTPGLISLFFGMAGVTVALIVWLLPIPQTAQWLLFSFLSVVYILLLRKTMKKVFNGDKEVSERLNDDFTGRLAIVADPIAPTKPGRVEFNGSTWTAEAESELLKGQSVRILGKKNLTVKVEAV